VALLVKARPCVQTPVLPPPKKSVIVIITFQYKNKGKDNFLLKEVRNNKMSEGMPRQI
jgi:hypothetical protein